MSPSLPPARALHCIGTGAFWESQPELPEETSETFSCCLTLVGAFAARQTGRSYRYVGVVAICAASQPGSWIRPPPWSLAWSSLNVCKRYLQATYLYRTMQYAAHVIAGWPAGGRRRRVGARLIFITCGAGSERGEAERHWAERVRRPPLHSHST